MRAQGLSKDFGSFRAVDRVDLEVPARQVYGFLGPNGSGKSTTIRMLCGLMQPSEGQIEVLGLQIPAQASVLRRRIGYMTQKFSLFEDLSVLENLEFMAAIQGIDQHRLRVASVIEHFHFSDRTHQLAGTLSGGQKQRLALACAVLHAPELLLLDEPTSAVDPQSRRDFWDTLFELADAGTTILVSTHLMDEAERCHRLAILDRGRLVADGTPGELTAALGGRIHTLQTSMPRAVKARLADLEGVLAVAQVGNALRVLSAVGVDDIAARIRAMLGEVDAAVAVETAMPNLEDVFVAATRHTAAAREAVV
ncbi:MAG TPA: ABC transporter ATP-binding protein [Chiayiivirga sp.]|nr:ABC transporter ATP-binding protein [Chiayiivirga sp.]